MKINGVITDPDSKTDVLNALNGVPGCPPRVPGFHDPLLSNVMNNTELEEYYTWFLFDVDNEGDPERDNEGNPLNYRISPGIFTKWAAGARKKDRLNTAEIECDAVERARQEELKGEKPPGNPIPLVWSALKPQYDEESGSAISPAYSVEEHPSPLMSPRGKLAYSWVPMLPKTLNIGCAQQCIYRNYNGKKAARSLMAMVNKLAT